MPVCICLHANLQYAEIPPEDKAEVCEKCYLPFLKMLSKIKEVKITFDFSGWTLEYLRDNSPEVIEYLKEGIERGNYELTAGTYAHSIIPLLYTVDAEMQIKESIRILKDILNYEPKGFFPPEYAWDPILPKILKKHGIIWSFVDEELLEVSSYGLNEYHPYFKRTRTFSEKLCRFYQMNRFNQALHLFALYKDFITRLKKVDVKPFLIKGVEEQIIGIKAVHPWSMFTGGSLARVYGLNERMLKRRVKCVADKIEGLLLIYSSDIEFFGYDKLIFKIEIERFKDFIGWLIQQEKISLVNPTEYLEGKEEEIKETYYLKAGSWEPDKMIDIWLRDADNYRLNRLVDEAREYLRGADENKEEVRRGWKYLLLAENSDGRGWNPLPERRLECYQNALKAIEVGKKIKGEGR